MAMSLYAKNIILNNWFRNEPYDFPDTQYLGVLYELPNAEGTLNMDEPTTGSYQRYTIPSNSTYWEAASGGKIKNAKAFRFIESTDDWTTVSHQLKAWATFDAATGGNMIFYGLLQHPQQVPMGSVLEIPEGELKTSILDVLPSTT